MARGTTTSGVPKSVAIINKTSPNHITTGFERILTSFIKSPKSCSSGLLCHGQPNSRLARAPQSMPSCCWLRKGRLHKWWQALLSEPFINTEMARRCIIGAWGSAAGSTWTKRGCCCRHQCTYSCRCDTTETSSKLAEGAPEHFRSQPRQCCHRLYGRCCGDPATATGRDTRRCSGGAAATGSSSDTWSRLRSVARAARWQHYGGAELGGGDARWRLPGLGWHRALA
mmetsp:Transcript_62705/g.158355  ORF Transcript_62705/g.158355 Transcript_62705/m.158355 type:complete len:227 (-) Transcript_62705:714-1394(-)